MTLKSEKEQHLFQDYGKRILLISFCFSIYLLVIKEEHNVKVGRKLYSKEKAEVRLLDLEVSGITLEIMGFNQACGLQNKNSDTKGEFKNHLS